MPEDRDHRGRRKCSDCLGQDCPMHIHPYCIVYPKPSKKIAKISVEGDDAGREEK